MERAIRQSKMLRRILLGDALVSGCVVLLLTLGAGTLAPWIGVPERAVQLVGLALIPWVALLLWTGSRPEAPLAAVWTVIVLNAAGAVACVALAVGLRGSLTPFGVVFMAVNGLGALLLSVSQYLGLQRSSPAAG